MKNYAIAMWDFSWLERPEYDDWDKSLDELQERGYNALRIECYPAIFPATKVIDPIWTSNDWGSPVPVEVESFKLLDFLAKCKGRNIKVGLSTWWRGWQYQYDFYAGWKAVLDNVVAFKDTILFVDLTNEFPMELWTKHFCGRSLEEKYEWADNMLMKFKKNYDYDFCFNTHLTHDHFRNSDYLNVNIWMAIGQFYSEIGYTHRFHDNKGYDALRNGEYVYRLKEEQWLQQLTSSINDIADYSKRVDKYLITTEGWGPIDYKDYHGLNWGWVKDCCAAGVEAALKTKRWKVMCTSNFCGPQFKGMWNDIEWHKKLTGDIKNG
jgi:hypothetical protein